MKNDKGSKTLAGLVGGSLVLGALAGSPVNTTAAPLAFAYLGNAAELRSQLIAANEYGEAAKKEEAKEACKCPEDKTGEGKCGEGKCGAEEGETCKCPEKKDAAATDSKAAAKADDKSEEGKCGEGKCA